MKDNIFFDSNISLYLLSDNDRKKEIAKELMLLNFVISTQVISENISVINKKFKLLSKIEVDAHLRLLIKNATITIIYLSTLNTALFIKEKYQLQWYDSLIVAAALEANCTILYTEDMQHGLIIEGKLSIINPFI